MGKNISVIIKKDTINLGRRGKIIKVKRGYAFNYLIPNYIVEKTTKGLIKHYGMISNIAAEKIENAMANLKQIKNEIESIHKITIKKKVGKDQMIFGSINDKEIIEEIKKYSSVNLGKQRVEVPSIKKIGIYSLSIQLSSTIKAQLKLQILPKDI
uniref:50S ribosomal protein L9, chloroplastic n=1 Tax=Rhodymenia pseudopalmata TaxID=31502 RepID=A0A1C9C7S9_RHOPU|nr:ribosomal protein L9 [Rhodymenia pseudopalmata]AOM64436.1 ribosomal protein L9 [Rhodymenia pseudopalmata]